MTPVARIYEKELVDYGHLTTEEITALKEDAIS